MTDNPLEKFLISGHGDNSLLICNYDTCKWSMPFPMAEPLLNILGEADNHAQIEHLRRHHER